MLKIHNLLVILKNVNKHIKTISIVRNTKINQKRIRSIHLTSTFSKKQKSLKTKSLKTKSLKSINTLNKSAVLQYFKKSLKKSYTLFKKSTFSKKTNFFKKNQHFQKMQQMMNSKYVTILNLQNHKKLLINNTKYMKTNKITIINKKIIRSIHLTPTFKKPNL